MATNRMDAVFGLAPDVGTAGHAGSPPGPGPRLNGVVRENAKRRNDVFREVFVLIVSPDEDEVRMEIINGGSNFIQSSQEDFAMAHGCSGAAIGSILLTHLLRPVFRILPVLRNRWVAQRPFQNSCHVFIAARQRRIVSHADAENFTHARKLTTCPQPEREGDLAADFADYTDLNPRNPRLSSRVSFPWVDNGLMVPKPINEP